ncbi:MAG TPA: OsmC family protein [Propionibacteriaceae bacterium]|nr:OsmC family protein [Propionibacteriaceae bacterium]
MGDYRATIRTLKVGETADWVVNHHLTQQAAIDVEMLSGGHLLHLAIAGCLFNDILREAPPRGITIDHLAVTAFGDFDQNGSRGVRYAIEILSANERSVVEQLVADLELEATIPKALRAEVAVESAGTTITTG